jgi:hypothetical protein
VNRCEVAHSDVDEGGVGRAGSGWVCGLHAVSIP